MTKFVKLSMVAGTEAVDSGEDDNLAGIREITKPVAVDPSQVRNFYPRRGNRIGTRIMFHNGSALPVSETFDEVAGKLSTD